MDVSIPTVRAIERVTLSRRLLIGVTAVRAVLGIVAIPLAPSLYHNHFILLVLLRPTKDVLLFGGFLLRDGSIGLVPLLVAAVPLVVGGVWIFYALGHAYVDELSGKSSNGLPRVVRRILKPDRVRAMGGVLAANRRVAILGGRLSLFPSSALAAAAGAGDMPPRDFLPLDGLGAALSLVEVLVVGYALGSAWERGSRLLTIAGLVVFVAILVVVGRWVRNEAKAPRRRKSSD
jgi:membrane protein DedA with SNARE-associated domain